MSLTSICPVSLHIMDTKPGMMSVLVVTLGTKLTMTIWFSQITVKHFYTNSTIVLLDSSTITTEMMILFIAVYDLRCIAVRVKLLAGYFPNINIIYKHYHN